MNEKRDFKEYLSNIIKCATGEEEFKTDEFMSAREKHSIWIKEGFDVLPDSVVRIVTTYYDHAVMISDENKMYLFDYLVEVLDECDLSIEKRMDILTSVIVDMSDERRNYNSDFMLDTFFEIFNKYAKWTEPDILF